MYSVYLSGVQCFSPSLGKDSPPFSVKSVSSQANIQIHGQKSQKSKAKDKGDNPDSRHTHKGELYGHIMTAPMQPQNFSMSFTSSSSGSAPVNLNSSSKDYQFVSTAPMVYQKKTSGKRLKDRRWKLFSSC
ncbi:LOW QUALITY PROTEIN: hypothetical protein YC2023_041620 [Brassica napus]